MNPNEWDLTKARMQDLHRQAEEHNIAQQARRNKPSRYATVMANVGEKMVEVGEMLQQRYGEFVEDAEPPFNANSRPLA